MQGKQAKSKKVLSVGQHDALMHAEATDEVDQKEAS
jgi:hypothetical protein